MAVAAVQTSRSVRDQVSVEEWDLRVELAALYRSWQPGLAHAELWRTLTTAELQGALDHLIRPLGSADASTYLDQSMAHVARLDWAMLIVGRIATALYWFNPMVWMLARRAHELAEQAVDDLGEIDRLDPQRAAQLIMAARAHWFAESKESA